MNRKDCCLGVNRHAALELPVQGMTIAIFSSGDAGTKVPEILILMRVPGKQSRSHVRVDVCWHSRCPTTMMEKTWKICRSHQHQDD